MPQKDTLDRAAYNYMLVSYQRLSPQFQFSLSGVTLVYLPAGSALCYLAVVQYTCTQWTYRLCRSCWVQQDRPPPLHLAGSALGYLAAVQYTCTQWTLTISVEVVEYSKTGLLLSTLLDLLSVVRLGLAGTEVLYTTVSDLKNLVWWIISFVQQLAIRCIKQKWDKMMTAFSFYGTATKRSITQRLCHLM